MFDDFFIRALVAGIGIALVAGPLGCFCCLEKIILFWGYTFSFSITWRNDGV